MFPGEIFDKMEVTLARRLTECAWTEDMPAVNGEIDWLRQGRPVKRWLKNGALGRFPGFRDILCAEQEKFEFGVELILDPSWLMAASIVVLIGLSAFFSGTETAFSSLNRIRMKHQADEGDPRAATALSIADDFDAALTTILIGNNIVNIGSTAIATVLFTNLLGASGAAVSTVVMTILVLIFGEIMPKSLAKENSEKVALGVGPILHALMVFFKPAVWFFKGLKSLASRLGRAGASEPSVTEEELKYIIETIETEGVIDEAERDLVQSALDFDDISVKEILVPRVDMFAVDIEDTPQEIFDQVMEENYSRIPVYEKSIDNIIGILSARDLLEARVKGEEIDIRSLLNSAVFIHRSMKISAAMNVFKKHKQHMAIVTDDYGGTQGLVTMEDILEELVGEIWDESDEVVNEFRPITEDSFEVSGDMNVYEMFEEIGVELPRDFSGNYTSVSGWVLDVMEHIPERNESFEFCGVRVTVWELEDQRITKLLVEKLPKEEDEPSQPKEKGKKKDE